VVPLVSVPVWTLAKVLLMSVLVSVYEVPELAAGTRAIVELHRVAGDRAGPGQAYLHHRQIRIVGAQRRW